MPEAHLLNRHRLQENESSSDEEWAVWKMIYMGFVLLIMFVASLSERIGADMIMLAALTLCLAAKIVTVEEGISGFSNEGVLTVMALYIIAAGIQLTGSMDWYMEKTLGRPNKSSQAQIRLMVSIASISAFLNNTPVVVVGIPFVLKWSKTIGISPAQLLIPLSFASILGGTCTLIGTSTNLVVKGLFDERYLDDPATTIGLFDLSKFGVPVALIGISYVLIASPYLLPGGKLARTDRPLPDDDGTILLGARLTRWSPAAGRSVKRSGLRDTGGIYLVSVYRAATGNVHRAVGQEFVLNVGDVLYFTGMIEEFGEFCDAHGLEVVTNEVDVTTSHLSTEKLSDKSSQNQKKVDSEIKQKKVQFASDLSEHPVKKRTRQSRLNADSEKLQAINKMSDMIRGYNSLGILVQQVASEEVAFVQESTSLTGSAKIVVLKETKHLQDMVIVGINSDDRPGLLLDISRALHKFGLQLHHTEACVIFSRSISTWRCEEIDDNSPCAEEMLADLDNLLNSEVKVEAVKRRGLPVIRATVTEHSRLIGKNLKEVPFRETYLAAVVAVQKADKNEVETLSNVIFETGDVLVLQVDDDSPLLVRPPLDFYDSKKPPKVFSNLFRKSSQDHTKEVETKDENYSTFSELGVVSTEQAVPGITNTSEKMFHDVWQDLRVLFNKKDGDKPHGESGNSSREFLTAMKVTSNSPHTKKTVTQAGLDKLLGLFLVQIERPVANDSSYNDSIHRSVVNDMSKVSNHYRTGVSNDEEMPMRHSIPVPPDAQLEEGDYLWFAGHAAAISDLRKIPGLISTEDDELQKMKEKVHDRRLVQVVIARNSPLAGKTAKEVGFRTRYGAAVIAVHRDGTRVQDHPGNIKLQSGDVLLLEAGPTFISRHSDNQHSFVLISEVKDSKPPRWGKLIPALILLVTTLVLVTLGVASLLVCSLITTIIMVFSGILSQQECRDAIDWKVYVTISSTLGIGKALTNSGLANLIANGFVNVGKAMKIGDAGLYGAIYLATFLISNVVTNVAAAALMFPIAIVAAEEANADTILMAYNLMLAASASFMTPFGNTTNLLTYGPGGYRVMDFFSIGIPMQIILWILTTVLLSNTVLTWYLTWIITFVVFILVFLMLMYPQFKGKH